VKAASRTRIVLLGPPASGKGTQAERIEKRYGLPAVSSGAILREEFAHGSQAGHDTARMARAGLLVPDRLVIKLVGRWLSRHPEGFILDGFPRNVPQAEALAKLLGENPLQAVLFFDLSDETIFERALGRMVCRNCGRSFRQDTVEKICPQCGGGLDRRGDDQPGVIEARLREYREKTAPLIEYYQHKNLLWTISAAQSPEKVFEEVRVILEK